MQNLKVQTDNPIDKQNKKNDMKKIIIWLLASLLLINLSSCKKNEMPVFDLDTKSALNIWFGTMAASGASSTADIPTDTVKHNFGDQTPGISVQITFNVRLFGGMVTEQDRPFTLETVHGNAEKAFIETGTFVLKGGEYQASFPITFNLPVGGTEDFTTEPELLVFRVKENEYFTEGVEERSRLNVLVKNENTLTRPTNWDTGPNPFSLRLSNYFGAYSVVKHLFIVQTIGRPLNFNVVASAQGNVAGMDNIGTFHVILYQNACRIALFEYNQANPENPMRDEDGELIVFP
jgi:hypothetical protein